MIRNRLLAGGLAALVVLSVYGGLLAQGPAPGTATSVVGINVAKIFNEYQRQKDLAEEMRETEQRLNLERDRRKQEIDARQASLEAMDRNDPTAVDQMRKLFKLQLEFKVWAELTQADMTREMAVWSARIYAEILDAVEQIAAQDGYEVALLLDEFRPILSDPEAVAEQIRNRKVLYCSPSAEITDIVLKKLNDVYRAEPRKKMLDIP